MTPSSPRESAKIYQFPTRTRPPAGGHREAFAREVASIGPRYATVTFGGGWYHDTAIEEAGRVLER